MIYQIFFQNLKKIFKNGYIGYCVYSICSLLITYSLFKLSKIPSGVLYDLKKILCYYLIFFCLYGPHKKITLKKYFFRLLISSFILLLLTSIIGDQL